MLLKTIHTRIYSPIWLHITHKTVNFFFVHTAFLTTRRSRCSKSGKPSTKKPFFFGDFLPLTGAGVKALSSLLHLSEISHIFFSFCREIPWYFLDFPQEEFAKFGYSWDRKIQKSSNPACNILATCCWNLLSKLAHWIFFCRQVPKNCQKEISALYKCVCVWVFFSNFLKYKWCASQLQLNIYSQQLFFFF